MNPLTKALYPHQHVYRKPRYEYESIELSRGEETIEAHKSMCVNINICLHTHKDRHTHVHAHTHMIMEKKKKLSDPTSTS